MTQQHTENTGTAPLSHMFKDRRDFKKWSRQHSPENDAVVCFSRPTEIHSLLATLDVLHGHYNVSI